MQRKNIIPIISMLATLFAADLVAQSDSVSNVVRYTTEFKFREGFYLNFDQVKNNKPIPKSRLLTSIDYNSKTFFDQVTELQSITYFDDLGNSQDVETKNLWGYSKMEYYILMLAGRLIELPSWAIFVTLWPISLPIPTGTTALTDIRHTGTVLTVIRRMVIRLTDTVLTDMGRPPIAPPR